MESIVPVKMKRKGFGDVFDDFSGFSLSEPATKIRRLDAEFPPIVEDRQPVVGTMFEDELSEREMSDSEPNVERALVLYKPVNTQLVPSFKINPELITGIKNCGAFWQGINVGEENQSSSLECLSMIPWVPPQAFQTAPVVEVWTSRSRPLEEPMEEEDDGVSSMEIEDDQLGDSGENLLQWKKHCLTPELSQTASTSSTPIRWL